MKKIFILLLSVLFIQAAVLAQVTIQPGIPNAGLIPKKLTASNLITTANSAATVAECGPCILNVTSRAQYNQPSLYLAKCGINILPGFVSVINDGFIAYIDNTLLPCDSVAKNSYLDKSVVKNINTYPLKTVDIFTAAKPLQVYPNPANSIVFVEINSALQDDVIISVIDMSGKKILEQRRTIKGHTVFSLNITHFAKGIYTILVNGKTTNEVQKLIKQ